VNECKPLLSGVRLVVDIKYYNQELENSESSSISVGTEDVYAIVEVTPPWPPSHPPLSPLTPL